MVTTRRLRIPLACCSPDRRLCSSSGEEGLEALKEAQQNVKSGAGEQYFDNVFFKEFFGKYATHMTECTQRTGEKMMVDLTAAVELGGRGQVLTVLVRPEMKPSRCFADLVKRDTFSAPPSGHFWIPVTIKFTEQ